MGKRAMQKENQDLFEASTVLIVDDDPMNIELVENYLKKFGLTILMARDGETALKRSRYAQPDIILMDVMMPGTDGFETCQRLKLDEVTKDIPVIFMTALMDPKHKLKAFSIGAVDYVTKPVQQEELLARVITHLRIHKYQEHLEKEVRERTSALQEKMLALETEINDRKQAEEQLRKAQTYISNIIDSMPSMLVGVDPEVRITQWNLEAEKVTGVPPEEALGKELVDIFPRLETEMDLIRESMRNQKVQVVPKKAQYENGDIRYEDVTVYPLIGRGVDGAVIRIDDVTEQSRMEEMLIQSEKVLLVGGLAAGIAHEINNPLAGMMQTSQVITNRLTDNEMPANIRTAEDIGISIESITAYMEKRDIIRMLNIINESGIRIADIIDNMLGFARQDTIKSSSHDIVALIDKTLELAATDYDLKKQYDFKSIDIVKKYEKNIPLVPCEEIKIQQVLLNIFRNGAQAMQETLGDESSPRFIIRLSLEKESKMVRIEIEDNGPGMKEEIRNRVFEPFFTTKPVGIGTGLGLSVSYFIISEKHGGTMDVASSTGNGANFIIRLPLETTT